MIYQALPLPSNFDMETEPIYLLDIETTGLCKQSHTILLIGLLENMQHKFFYHFWLCEHRDEEKELLNVFFSHLTSNRKLYTYGGTSFDLAFIAARAAYHDLDFTLLTGLTKIDFKKSPLFKSLFPGSKSSRSLLEEHFHYTRTLTTQGRELAKIASLYLTAPTPTYQELLLKHNQEDLLSLLSFLRVYQILNQLHPTQLMTQEMDDYRIIYTFTLPLTYPSNLTLQLGPYTLSYIKGSTIMKVTLEAMRLTLRQYLPYKDYYIVNGLPMHRSLAHFIPSDLRQKATRATAFLEKEDFFVPFPKQHTCWEDTKKNTYIPFQEALDAHPILLKDLSKKITRGLMN